MTSLSACTAAAKLFCLVATGLMLSASVAAAQSTGGTIGIVLSNPSALGSSTYLTLFEVAGRPEKEPLPLTNSEVWTIAAGDWDSIAKAAEQLGIKLRRLDENWNHALMPMGNSEPMTSEQKSMKDHAMHSKAAVGMSMMALPDASIEEYALTKGMHEAAPATDQPSILIPLTADLSISARRTSVSKTAGGYAWHGVVEDTGEPVTLLWWPAGKMTGTATYKGRIYAIHSLGGGMHGVVQMDPNALPQDHAPMGGSGLPNAHVEKDPLVAKGDASAVKAAGQKIDSGPQTPNLPKRSDTHNLEDAAPSKLALAVPNASALTIVPSRITKPDVRVTIRIIVAYTAAAAKAYSEIETDLIALAIEQANQSFRDSGVGNV
jgi:hypothetical protein